MFRDVRERDLVGREGRFVAEGRLVVSALLTGTRFRARSVLVSPSAFESIRQDLEAAEQIPDVYVASVETMSSVAGFPIHRGCLAIGERLGDLRIQDLIAPAGQPSLLVVLEDLANHDNVGSVFRNAAAFGASGVLLSPRCCDPLYRKAIRVSMASALRVPFARAGAWPNELGLLRDHAYTTVALVTDRDAIPIADHAPDAGARVALLIGAEGPGLDGRTALSCDARVRIPISGEIDSLNASVAGAIALHRYSERLGHPRH